jgi:hypothetical protein
MSYFAGNLAKEAGRLYGWKEKFWGRRYSHVVVSDETEAQEARLRYLLAQGCKEGLVRRPEDWPGPSSTEALLTGNTRSAVWFDRSAEYEARRRGQTVSKYEHAEVLDLQLTPLPAWADLSPEEQRHKARQMVAEIIEETRERLEEAGRPPLGAQRILRQNPHEAPGRPKRSPKPIVHAVALAARKSLKLQCYLFRHAYRKASEALRAGNTSAEFPPGCHRPPLPFIRGHPSELLA